MCDKYHMCFEFDGVVAGKSPVAKGWPCATTTTCVSKIVGIAAGKSLTAEGKPRVARTACVTEPCRVAAGKPPVAEGTPCTASTTCCKTAGEPPAVALLYSKC